MNATKSERDRVVELAHEMLEVGTESKAIWAIAQAVLDRVAMMPVAPEAESEAKSLLWMAERLRELAAIRAVVEACDGRLHSFHALEVARNFAQAHGPLPEYPADLVAGDFAELLQHRVASFGFIVVRLLETAELMAEAWRANR